eukprot:UN10961
MFKRGQVFVVHSYDQMPLQKKLSISLAFVLSRESRVKPNLPRIIVNQNHLILLHRVELMRPPPDRWSSFVWENSSIFLLLPSK